MSDTFELKITGNSAEAVAALKKVSGELDKNRGKVKQNQDVLKNFKKNWLGITAAVAGTIAIVKKSISAFAEQNKVEGILNETFKKTTESADEATKQFIKFAQAQQRVTKFGDEVTIKAASQLQALAGLSEKGLEEATKATMNLASAMDIDLAAAASLVGKTIGSSTDALSRYIGSSGLDGVTDSAKRATLLVGKLNEKFGGFAEREGKTAIGTLAGISNAIGDMSEALGGALFPIITPIINAIRDFAMFVSQSEVVTAVMTGTLFGLTGALVAVKLGLLGTAVGLKAVMLASGVGAIIAAVVAAAVLIIKNWDKIKIFMVNTWNVIKFASIKAWSAIKIGSLVAAQLMIKAAGLIIEPYRFLFNFIIKGMNKVFKSNIKEISDFTGNWIDNIDIQIAAEKNKNKEILLDGLKTYGKLSEGAKIATKKIAESSKEAGGGIKESTGKFAEGVSKVMGTAEVVSQEVVGRIADIQNSATEKRISKAEETAEAEKTALDLEFENKLLMLNNELDAQEAAELSKEGSGAERAKKKEKFDKKRLAAEEKLTKDKAKKEEEIEKKKEIAIAQARVKQFRMSKATGIIEAIISTAGGIARALVNPGGIAGIVLAAVIGGLGAAQIGIIASQKAPSVPSFAEGGIISSPTAAIVGDNPTSPEVVAPLHKLNEMLDVGASVVIENAYFQAQSPQELFSQFLEFLDSMAIKTVARV